VAWLLQARRAGLLGLSFLPGRTYVQAYSDSDRRFTGHQQRRQGIALAIKLGAKVTAYYAVEGLQPIYGEGYLIDQKVIDGFEEARVR